MNNVFKALLRRSVALTLALIVIISSCGLFDIFGNTDTERDDAVCGIMEHIHSEECYTSLALCEISDEEHVHGDGCFIPVLTCGLEEHTHTEACYAEDGSGFTQDNNDFAAYAVANAAGNGPVALNPTTTANWGAGAGGVFGEALLPKNAGIGSAIVVTADFSVSSANVSPRIYAAAGGGYTSAGTPFIEGDLMRSFTTDGINYSVLCEIEIDGSDNTTYADRLVFKNDWGAALGTISITSCSVFYGTMDEYNEWVDTINKGRFEEIPIDGAYTEDIRNKNGIIFLTWVDDPDNPYTFTAPIDGVFKNPYRANPNSYIKIVIENGEITDLGGYNGQFYSDNNSTWLGGKFAPIVVRSADSAAYYYPAAGFIRAYGNIDNLWGIVARGTGTVKSFGLVTLEAVFEKEPNKIYYRTKDRFGDYIYGTSINYLLGEDNEADVRPFEKIEVYAEVDTEDYTFVYNSGHLKQIGNINREYNDVLEKWVMTATYKVIDFFEEDTSDTVSSAISLVGTDAGGDPVSSEAQFIIYPAERIELNKIYYKRADETDYKLNDTTDTDLFGILDGDDIDLFTEVKIPTLDSDEVYSLLGSMFGFIVEGSELSLRSSVVCRLADEEEYIWRISANYTADEISNHAKINLRNNGEVVDILHIRIDYEVNKIYYKLPGEDHYRKNYGKDISAYLGDEIELIALVENQNAKFTVDSTTNFRLSDMEYEETSDGGWYVKATAIAIRTTSINYTTSINLIVNSENVDILKVNIKEFTYIHVHNMKLGNMDYDYVDIHTATDMLTGNFSNWNNYKNSGSNRYIVFVGETLDLSATTNGTFTGYESIFKSLGAAADEITPNNDAQIVGASIRLLATKPGDIAITVNDGTDSETFYVSVRYPIYIKTAMGNVHKNRHHEYLWEAFFTGGGPDFINDMNFNPVYAKNLGDKGDQYRYCMFVGGTVELTAYAIADGQKLTCTNTESDHLHVESCFTGTMPKFTSSSNAAQISHTYAIEKIGGTDFIKIAAIVKVISNPGNPYYIDITFNGRTDPIEKFFIYVMQTNKTLQHFDIEVADGGTYTTVDVITEVDQDGNPIKRTVTEITYDTVVSAVRECRIYGENDVLLCTVEEWEYWKHGIKGEDTQFEITSAYVTDRDTHEPPDPENPELKGERQVNASSIKKVVFDLTLEIDPIATRRTVSIWDPALNDWRLVTDEDDPDYSAPPRVEEVGKNTVNGFSAEMSIQDIIDAINKCPNHGGGDFTLMSNNSYPSISLDFTKELYGRDLKANEFTFDLYEDTRANKAGKPDSFDSTDIKRVGVAFNTVDGIIRFNSIEYVFKGEYTYYAVERPGTDNTIVYDDTILKIVVNISEIDDTNLNSIYDNLLAATITYYHWDDSIGDWVWNNFPPRFTNYYSEANLPATGGIGTKMFIYVGGTLTLLGVVLLAVNKKRSTDA